MKTKLVKMNCTMMDFSDCHDANPKNFSLFSFIDDIYDMSADSNEMQQMWSDKDDKICHFDDDPFYSDFSTSCNDYWNTWNNDMFHSDFPTSASNGHDHSPLLKDSFLTTPIRLVIPNQTNELSGDGAKDFDEDEHRQLILERIAMSDLTNCVNPNEIFSSVEAKSTSSQTNAAAESDSTALDYLNSHSGSSTSSSSSASIDDLLWTDSDSDDMLSSSQQSEEEIDEIDVVSVPRPREAVTSSISESRILPATMLVSERVAALHNYSSRPTIQCRRQSVRQATSAPQSPSDRAVPVAKRCVSNPASPVIQHTSVKRKYRRNMQDRRTQRQARSRRFKVYEDQSKRAQHNVLERKRRSELMAYFHSLRDQIPLLKNNGRVSKSVILGNAKQHILKLEKHMEGLQSHLEAERRQLKRLQRSLEKLNVASSVYASSRKMSTPSSSEASSRRVSSTK